jgi:hypothetical protein
MENKPTPIVQDINQITFRRSEDWERLTRLEFLVEEVIRDNERRDSRIEAIINAQDRISTTQQTVITQLRKVQHLVIGALVGIVASAVGLDKILNILPGLLL